MKVKIDLSELQKAIEHLAKPITQYTKLTEFLRNNNIRFQLGSDNELNSYVRIDFDNNGNSQQIKQKGKKK